MIDEINWHKIYSIFMVGTLIVDLILNQSLRHFVADAFFATIMLSFFKVVSDKWGEGDDAD